jgi:hypothetical protein
MRPESAELRSERATLMRADRDIAEGEQRLRRQAARADELRKHGHEPGQADRLVETFRATLDVWKEHRRLIRDRIAYLEESEYQRG